MNALRNRRGRERVGTRRYSSVRKTAVCSQFQSRSSGGRPRRWLTISKAFLGPDNTAVNSDPFVTRSSALYRWVIKLLEPWHPPDSVLPGLILRACRTEFSQCSPDIVPSCVSML
jgi:hypothetical protein